MGDGRGTQTGLIGEDAAGHALLHGGEHGADHAAGDGRRAECAPEDHAEHAGHVFDVDGDHAQAQHHIEQRHEGNQALGHAADALDAAQQHQAHQEGDQDADAQVDGLDSALGSQAEAGERGVDGGDDGVDLGGVAGAEHCQCAQCGEHAAQPHPLLAQTVLDEVHRAAHPVALGVALAVVHGQRDLHQLGAHAQQRGDPHPEHCAGAADGDCARHARDVAGAHGGGKCGAHRLEGGDGALGGLAALEDAADGLAHGRAEPANLDAAGAQREVQAHADDQDHGGYAPDEVVHGLVDVGDEVQHGQSLRFSCCAPLEGQKKPRPHDACIRTEAVFRGTTLLCLHLAAQTFLSR